MSNSLAIAAVTATLKNLLSKVTDPLPGDPLPDPGDLSDAWVSTKPPDKARDPQEKDNQLNLFLFQLIPNAAFRNSPMPGTRDGQPSPAPLALDLYFLLSAYGRGSDDILAHKMMGRAMSILHENGELTRLDIRNALAGNDLYRQIERVKIIYHHLSVEEISKLWTIYQSAYRLTTAYHVSVVLIDTPLPSIAPLPVLQRGPLRGPPGFQTDTGAIVQPSLAPMTPTILTLSIPGNRPSARIGAGAPGDLLTLGGANFAGAVVQAQFQHAMQAATNTLPVTVTSADQATVQLPGSTAADQASWPAGPWSLSLLVDGRPSNTVYLTLAPRIVPSVSPPSGGNITVTVNVSGAVWPDQRVSLLFDDQELRGPQLTTLASTLAFTLPTPASGVHNVRLRVDNVDSLLIADYTAKVPAFDPTQQVTV